MINSSATRSFLSTVKLDHVVWKMDLYQRIAAGNLSQSLTDHHECRLGQWYYRGQGADLYSHLPAYRQLENVHRQVHECGLQARDAALKGAIDRLHRLLLDMEQAAVSRSPSSSTASNGRSAAVTDLRSVRKDTAATLSAIATIAVTRYTETLSPQERTREKECVNVLRP
ncbi:CZB domain-containing protein [Halopseudomonas pachastrellae]|nr:CZB domain-containing protein [Halopseudomonas pachastrellae]